MSTTTAPELDSNVGEISGDLELGKGARFWVYISPQNDTKNVVTFWEVTFAQQNSNWSGTITSRNPTENLQTPGLSGNFTVSVRGSIKNQDSIAPFPPKPPSTDKIGCNNNCASFVGIVANPDQNGATYWTTWDAICSRS